LPPTQSQINSKLKLIVTQISLSLAKPKMGESCNGCGYCCSVEPCMLAQEFLGCITGPCIALERTETKFICGLVRDPLGYLFKAAHPNAEVSVLEAPRSAVGDELANEIAAALGIGLGCDSDDSDQAADWLATMS